MGGCQKMITVDLYFVAYKKHGEIQHVVAGPFIDVDECDVVIDTHKYSRDRYVIVQTTVPVEEHII